MMICTYVAFLWNCFFHTFTVSECESSYTFKLNSSYTTHFVKYKTPVFDCLQTTRHSQCFLISVRLGNDLEATLR